MARKESKPTVVYLRRDMTREDRDSVIAMVAEFLEQFDSTYDGPYRMSDIVRFKFCLIGKRKLRKNPRRVKCTRSAK